MIRRPRGTKDIYGKDELIYKIIFDSFEQLATTYNLKKIITPTFESYELFKKINGEQTDIVSKETYDTWFRAGHPKIGDILFSTVGTIGLTSLMTQDLGCIAQNIIALRVNDKLLNNLYLYYFLNNKTTKINLNNLNIGGVQPSIKLPHLLNMPIALPPLAEQKRIADILSAIDDKIELNRRINANLEQQAQALYKSWFVDFEPFGGKMPEDWREGILNDILGKIATGLNPRKNFVLGKGNNYYVTIKNMGDNNIYLDDKCDKVDDEALQKINNRSRLQKGDILFSGIGTIGRTYLIDEEPNNWNTSESVFNLRPIKEIPSEFLYLLLLSDWFQQYVNVHAQGAVQQGIRMGDIKSCPMSIPTSVTITNFTKLVKPMISEVKNNQRKNLRLAQLRDTLLPKLMSGKITV